MTYGAQFMECPACGGRAECESVDVGVGLILRGDYACWCGWEIDSENDFGFVLMDERPFCPLDLDGQP